MAINVSVQYNGGLLPDIILLTQCYHHRGTCLNAMKRFCICNYWLTSCKSAENSRLCELRIDYLIENG